LPPHARDNNKAARSNGPCEAALPRCFSIRTRSSFCFPIVPIGFFLIRKRNARAAASFLACDDRQRKRLLIAALIVNLGVLAVVKDSNFFVSNVNEGLAASGLAPIPLLHIALPIGISFYTFTQIAFLVDRWQGKVHERSFIHYVLFVTYFPHLIAGPVLHHAQMMPQFALFTSVFLRRPFSHPNTNSDGANRSLLFRSSTCAASPWIRPTSSSSATALDDLHPAERAGEGQLSRHDDLLGTAPRDLQGFQPMD
jgi:hypothetical protein